ncbi:NmrA family NAD(P)-binding protein [Dyadobacter crusticola]|uniref:NmrA family NAD(P)-binding protein n=1 Tax=Dyadobacter crusticola TaxID=292407 RepID=UPI00055890C9|nr:NmrA family NAD(P)-binding protein [Dyadobacter crusticola]
MDLTKETNAASFIVVAGATGQLGSRITHYLLQKGAKVRAIVRKGSTNPHVNVLRAAGAEVVEVDFTDIAGLTRAITGASCVVSVLSGLREVIVGAQTRLLQASVSAGVARFIPSDYSIDYTKLQPGSNRNLDLRREFSEVVDKSGIKATSVLNGMFTDLLTGEAPLVLPAVKKVLYWGDAEQPLDFTTIENTAEFTAAAALDPTTPRYLRIAGEVATVKDLARAASEVHGKTFGTFRVGGLGLLGAMIKITRTIAPQEKETFPAWQGMQYMHNMFTGLPKLAPLDNGRYPGIRWISVKEVLAKG